MNPQTTASASASSQPVNSSQSQPNTFFGIGLIVGITLIIALAVSALANQFKGKNKEARREKQTFNP